MLYTNLKHLENATQHNKVINDNSNVIVCCGRMDPMCIPVYSIMEELEKDYQSVKFFDMEFDNSESEVIRNLPDVIAFMRIPFVVYYKNGKVVKATSGIQSKAQIIDSLNSAFVNNTVMR